MAIGSTSALRDHQNPSRRRRVRSQQPAASDTKLRSETMGTARAISPRYLVGSGSEYTELVAAMKSQKLWIGWEGFPNLEMSGWQKRMLRSPSWMNDGT